MATLTASPTNAEVEVRDSWLPMIVIAMGARIRALKDRVFVPVGPALLALFPCRWLPDYRPGEVPGGPPAGKDERE